MEKSLGLCLTIKLLYRAKDVVAFILRQYYTIQKQNKKNHFIIKILSVIKYFSFIK